MHTKNIFKSISTNYFFIAKNNFCVGEKYLDVTKNICQAIDASENMKYLVHASYLEIYNEEIRDLLGDDIKKKLDLKEHPERGVYVKVISVVLV